MNDNLRAFLLAATIAAQALFAPRAVPQAGAAETVGRGAGPLRIGWASADITPQAHVAMSGGSRARISRGVLDPITATALVLESDGDGKAAARVVLVSVDWGSVHADVQEGVLKKLSARLPEIDRGNLILFGTHTHAAPERRTAPDLVEKFGKLGIEVPLAWSWWGMDLGVTPSPLDYAEFAAGRIAGAVQQAWRNRKPGGVSFGLAHAVVGHNRLTAYDDGRSQMYGGADRPDFSHVEGCEDHSVNLLSTWNAEGKLTGVMVNLACPAQVSEGGGQITADFWHETRNELRKRLGDALYVLPQIAAAGDQSPRALVDRRAEQRMEKITGRDRRQEIAVRIADAVTSVLPFMEKNVDWAPVFALGWEQVELSRRRVTDEEAQSRRQDVERRLAEYRKMRQQIEANPEIRNKADWFREITPVYWHLSRAMRVLDRYELQRTQPTLRVPIHVVRIGDMAIATNPFELYLDYGTQIKTRSKAVQTFTVQLANGYHQYLPTERSVARGAYGAIPESNQVDPRGGRELVEQTLRLIDSLWAEKNEKK